MTMCLCLKIFYGFFLSPKLDVSNLKTISQNSASGVNADKSFGELRSQLPFLLFLVLIFFINFTARIIFSPLMPTIEADLSLTHRDAGLLFLLISFGYFMGMLGSGFLSAAVTHKKTISLSAIAVGLTLLPISFSSNKWILLIGLFVLGLSAGLYLPSGLATLTSIINPRQWGKAIAVHEMAPNLGFVAAPLLAEMFMLWFSWRIILLVLGVTSLLMGLTNARFGKRGKLRGEPPKFGAIRTLVKKRSFLIMLLLFCAGIGGFLGIYTMLPLYLVTEHGMDREMANTLVAISRIPGLAVVFIAGWATDRFGPKRTLVWIFMLTGIMTMALGFAKGFWISVFVFIQPMIAVCFPPAALVALSLIGPHETRNIAVSITIPFAFLIGGGMLPILIGILGDAGAFGLGIVIVGGLILLTSILPRYLIFMRS
jgi:NNP family nitrate/nitrite transporter-like MFS transporter